MRWISIEKMTEEHEGPAKTICIPGTDLQFDEVTLVYGAKRITAQVKKNGISMIKQDGEIDNGITYLSKALIEELCLVTTQPYQLKITESTIELGPVIGLLLGEQQYYYHHNTMQEYTDAMVRAEEFGGLVVAFKLCSIDWRSESVYGLYFDVKQKKWRYGKCPIPSVIYRRAFNHEDKDVELLKKTVGSTLFNDRKLDKLQMYQRLQGFPSFKRYLPETAKLTIDVFHRFLDRYDKIILKPADLSRGRGICVLQQDGDKLSIVDSLAEAIPIRIKLSREKAVDYISERGYLTKNYLVQPFLAFSKINGSPWDIRIIMQKNDNLRWQCNGIECRLAGANSYLTNISRGGRALTINQAIKLTYGPQTNVKLIKKQIISVATEFCTVMDDGDGHFAEFGLDFALDEQQNIWFIEANVRPTFNGFKRLEYKNYLHISSAPLFYAVKLSGFKRSKKHE
ncbi:YheC/YheD family endospore coat-associated protein [Dethiobacter alkaliphilus]|uniref:ATP-grasp domain-containing protein n=1 Tax=Dethiobacter alkaliphilus AHT 1 TaxID=555088 RepID=C0GCD8_DETAL|nr:YheC/YheD family protein [Dethiobacter alkaliphilus]EEG78873.1 hypothetical protein DealDRAFT_0147 [Dethiobacter alkaliphilus AHT 1]